MNKCILVYIYLYLDVLFGKMSLLLISLVYFKGFLDESVFFVGFNFLCLGNGMFFFFFLVCLWRIKKYFFLGL